MGLWAFIGPDKPGDGREERVFDILQEHLEWCPVRQTISGGGGTVDAAVAVGGADVQGGQGADAEVGWWNDLSLLRGANDGQVEEGYSAGVPTTVNVERDAGAGAAARLDSHGASDGDGDGDDGDGDTTRGVTVSSLAPTPAPIIARHTPPRGWLAVSDKLERKPWRR